MRRSRTFIFLGSTLLFLLSSPLLSGSSCSRAHDDEEASRSEECAAEEELAYEESAQESDEVSFDPTEEWEAYADSDYEAEDQNY